jgi:hypothetical protein
MLSELGMFARYARAVREYFAQSIDLAQARAILSTGLRDRESSLLTTIRGGIWDAPRSPYRPLFQAAGIEWGDVESLVKSDGVDEALRKLHRAGVYVTLDEFKGKRRIKRAGLDYAVNAEDFDSPLLTAHFEGRTGGTGGTRRRLLIDLGLIAHDAAAHRVLMESLGTTQHRLATWRPVPPNNSGLKKLLMGAHIGLPVDRWFSEQPVRWTPEEFKYAAFTAFTWAAARASGHRFAYPEHVPRDQVGTIVTWMAQMTAAGTPVYMDCVVSAAVRICSAALESRRDISGSIFRTGGEPLTETRAEVIRTAGARVVAGYATSETGPIGMACAEGGAADHLHVIVDKMAVIHVDPGDIEPGREKVLHLTTIFPSCPKVMLNVDTGDCGDLAQMPCGCEFGKLGFHLHLQHIRSYEKLTSEGILLPASEVVRLVEEVLPAAFGGGPTDYQLVEDGRDGLPVVRIVVSPRIGALDESAVVAAVLAAIRATGAGGRLTAGQLAQARSLTLMRREPFRSAVGKMLPLFVIRKE